jgi:nucleoside-diphosphate-sugar epimerase
MRVLVTGASGHIASAVVPELVQAGHQVLGLARSENSATAVKELGAEAVRGDLTDLGGLREAASGVDGVIHLAFDHELVRSQDFGTAASRDLAAVRAFGEALEGTGKVFMGVGMDIPDNPAERAAWEGFPRFAATLELAGLAERGVRAVRVAVPQVVHSNRDRHGFVPTLIRIARATGISAYVGEGANRWPAVHTLDLGRLYRLGLENAPAGAVLHGSSDDGVTVREIAENIARHLGIPAKSSSAEEAGTHFADFPFVTMDNPMPSADTRELLGWEPVHPRLIEDLDEGHYFA